MSWNLTRYQLRQRPITNRCLTDHHITLHVTGWFVLHLVGHRVDGSLWVLLLLRLQLTLVKLDERHPSCQQRTRITDLAPVVRM